MEILNFEGMGLLEMVMIVIAVVIVGFVLYFQIKSFKDTKEKIGMLASFFPHPDALGKIESSITNSIIEGNTTYGIALEENTKNSIIKRIYCFNI